MCLKCHESGDHFIDWCSNYTHNFLTNENQLHEIYTDNSNNIHVIPRKKKE